MYEVSSNVVDITIVVPIEALWAAFEARRLVLVSCVFLLHACFEGQFPWHRKRFHLHALLVGVINSVGGSKVVEDLILCLNIKR